MAGVKMGSLRLSLMTFHQNASWHFTVKWLVTLWCHALRRHGVTKYRTPDKTATLLTAIPTSNGHPW